MVPSFDPALLADFARFYGFHYDICDPAVLVRDVRIDMERGLQGKSSPLPMIPSYLRPLAQASSGKTVIALDAGGTNLRAARVRFRAPGRPEAEETRKAPMPGTAGRVNAEEFFDQIAGLAGPLMSGAPGESLEGIGFCFSYPMKMQENGDGIPMAFSKEVDAPEVIGRSIAQELRAALERLGLRPPKRIVLLNDTVATLLSGLEEIPPDGGKNKGPDTFALPGGPVVGCILGTGFNTAYPEKDIPKIGFHSKDMPQIVVCETGNAAPRYLGVLDREFDATTKHPGSYTMEKTTSGAYLGPLTFHILKQAIADGVLQFKRSAEFAALPALQTKDLNAFMHAPLAMEGPLGELFDRGELDAIRSVAYLTSIITKRGAMFSAAVVAAAVERMEAGYDPFTPVRIAVEGTTYMIYRGMREALESYLHVMLNREKPRSYIIAPVEQASLFGAAVAALSH
ncbi:MAG: hexokinase [Spirochaetaceae bacterium]|jgi:hexokinase|nr:hexokinase [Spirochaetaceae bacterium]